MKHTTTVTTITDDLGGTGTADTLRFTYDGTTYEIDLNTQNTATFHRRVAKLYGQYTAVARVVSAKKPAAPTEFDAVRAWAADNEWDIKNRGRIPQQIQDAYDAAHPDGAA